MGHVLRRMYSRTDCFPFNKNEMRIGKITTSEAIAILLKDGCIHWTEDAYINDDGVDWMMVSIFFNTNEIHTYCQGMVTRIII